VALALSWPLGLILAGIWLAEALLFRMASLASLAAADAAPALAMYFIGNWPEAWALFPIALLLVWRHRGNIRKIRSGQERRIGS
jgi:glycerol-3-phosphate acyltransferase PlsY